ncbi:MAG: hypothetical protein EAX95_12905 [Candidatus Thorarchaeota archaeon]|nr:hypothetical protein [Candidatus Thorarchaeota archaeon]
MIALPFIDKDFPTEEIDRLAWSESNSRKPIYHMHKWFARRVGCTYRALILSAFRHENPMDLFYSHLGLKNREGDAPVILDPFMGGGTTIIEGHRLGCKTIGIDINPVAWFITKKEMHAIDAKEAAGEFQRIRSSVAKEIGSSYATECMNGHTAEIMYSFWVRVLNCKRCGEEVFLFRTLRIARICKERDLYYCPHCRKFVEANSENAWCDCGFDLSSHFASNKRYECQSCGYDGDVTEAWLDGGNAPTEWNFGIEYYCSTCGRGYKIPDEKDYRILEDSKAKLATLRESAIGHIIPKQEVPWDRMTTMRPRCKVYKRFLDFFNSRQLFALSLILQEILAIKDRGLKELFLLIFSDALNANNMFCIYNATARKIEPLFGGHYFSPPMMPVENNVLGAKLGRGSFSKYFGKAVRALHYQKQPYEIKFQSVNEKVGRVRVDIHGDFINGKEADYFVDLMGTADTLLRCASSENLEFLPDRSIDAVITDPPYYDNIMYSELSNLFYCWLRIGLEETYPDEFGQLLSGREHEILVQSSTGKDHDFYVTSMTRVFCELHRVLKDEGYMIFVFQHKRIEAWIALLQILVDSSFCITSVYPSHGETPSGVRAHGANYNAILVCRKTPKRMRIESPASIEDQISKAIFNASRVHPELAKKDALIVALGKALQIYSQNCTQESRPDFDLQMLGTIVEEAVERHWT